MDKSLLHCCSLNGNKLLLVRLRHLQVAETITAAASRRFAITSELLSLKAKNVGQRNSLCRQAAAAIGKAEAAANSADASK